MASLRISCLFLVSDGLKMNFFVNIVSNISSVACFFSSFSYVLVIPSRLGFGELVFSSTGLVKNRSLWCISKWSPNPTSPEAQRNFLDIKYGNLVEALEVKSTILWDPPSDWVFLEVLTLWLVYTEPPSTHKVQFRCSCPGVPFPAQVLVVSTLSLPSDYSLLPRGMLECNGVGNFHPLGSVRHWSTPEAQFRLSAGLVKRNKELWAYFKMDVFLPTLLEAWGDFSPTSLWECSRVSRGKTEKKCVALLKYGIPVFLSQTWLLWASSNSSFTV